MSQERNLLIYYRKKPNDTKIYSRYNVTRACVLVQAAKRFVALSLSQRNLLDILTPDLEALCYL